MSQTNGIKLTVGPIRRLYFGKTSKPNYKNRKTCKNWLILEHNWLKCCIDLNWFLVNFGREWLLCHGVAIDQIYLVSSTFPSLISETGNIMTSRRTDPWGGYNGKDGGKERQSLMPTASRTSARQTSASQQGGLTLLGKETRQINRLEQIFVGEVSQPGIKSGGRLSPGFAPDHDF